MLAKPCFDPNATCLNNQGSYTCRCPTGYRTANGDAKTETCDSECEKGRAAASHSGAAAILQGAPAAAAGLPSCNACAPHAVI